ncbi:MAG: hypothetical protein LBP64_01300 [Tannerella sp.]|jgi:hypothetical protein|nr:hypothetical protein [Tannerella sp.]
MENLSAAVLNLFGTLSSHACLFLSSLLSGEVFTPSGSGLTLAFALGMAGYGNIAEGVMTNVRRWHGKIEDRFTAVNNLVNIITANQPAWPIPADLLTQLTGKRDDLQSLIHLCRTSHASPADRALRNSLLKSTVSLCLIQVKIWAYAEFSAGVLTADDVHLLGFLLPGEIGGRRSRTEATNIVAEVKVKVINEDFIRVVIDRSAGENAALTAHGWPYGVRNALIVITSADGKTEVYRRMTTRLHNKIRMPDGSHGKQFIIKASFLKHVDDEPHFGNAPTFSMPLTTEDLVVALSRQHHEGYEAQLREEIERQRQLIEQLSAQLNAQKD